MSITIEASSQPRDPSFRELITPFDDLPDEFGELKKEIRDIGVAGTPFQALHQTRRALECVVQDVYERRFREPTDRIELVEMIEQLYKADQVPPLVFFNAGFVRSLGNLGAHSKRGRSANPAPMVSYE